MATLTTTLPRIAFPHELDHISIESDGEVSVEVKITVDHTVIFQSTLYFDDNGFIDIINLADVIRTYVDDKKVISVALDGLDVGQCAVIPCSMDIGEKAAEFTPRHFLSLSGRVRTTTPDSVEYLSYYSEDGQEICDVQLLLMKDGYLRSKVASSTTLPQKGLVLQTFKVADFIKANPDAQLLSFTVLIGQREQRFLVRNLPDVQMFLFRNCFNRLELCGFAEVEKKPVNDWKTASINGKMRTYKADQHFEYKCLTGELTTANVNVLQDFSISKDIVLLPRKVPMLVTAIDLKQSSSIYESRKGSVTLRECGNAPRADVDRPVHTFDKTFDATFK